ncbi:hypothetical protein GUJ93_ZPchr0015g7003 [Zizania palustris]|uniref:Uncharacterized protein n=1 Tax=Zizania palustris TaxID=103762 RepID=A0A8J5T8U8_ZIZPA|nr:hypothetical protein GUJ93_ZPchr0015g7003 [Zizania palustris]
MAVGWTAAMAGRRRAPGGRGGSRRCWQEVSTGRPGGDAGQRHAAVRAGGGEGGRRQHGQEAARAGDGGVGRRREPARVGGGSEGLGAGGSGAG